MTNKDIVVTGLQTSVVDDKVNVILKTSTPFDKSTVIFRLYDYNGVEHLSSVVMEGNILEHSIDIANIGVPAQMDIIIDNGIQYSQPFYEGELTYLTSYMSDAYPADVYASKNLTKDQKEVTKQSNTSSTTNTTPEVTESVSTTGTTNTVSTTSDDPFAGTYDVTPFLTGGVLMVLVLSFVMFKRFKLKPSRNN